MMVNGEPVLTCATYLSALPAGPVRVEPLKGFPVIRDLVGDTKDFVDKLQSVKPWIVRREEKPLSQGEYLQTPEELAEYKKHSMCINCLLCYAACPIYLIDSDFIGPAALALAHRYNLDSRDQGKSQRLDILADHDGVWVCSFVGACSEVCPKTVDPAAAIQQMKIDGAMEWWKRKLGFPGGDS